MGCILCLFVQYQRELVAQAAGVQFVSASQLQDKNRPNSDDDEEEEEDDDDDDGDEDGEEEENAFHGDVKCSDSDQDTPTQGQGSRSTVDPAKRGTEVKLQSLQLKENAATLMLTSMALVIQCSRCKNRCDLTSPAGRINSVPCPKCNGEQLVTLRAAMAHQFSSVIGYLDLAGCMPHDLILSECHFAVNCLSCNMDMAMQVCRQYKGKQMIFREYHDADLRLFFNHGKVWLPQ